MEEKLDIFRKLHNVFLDLLLDDTWLCTSPISEEDFKACWYWAVKLGIETVPEEDFEETFKLSFKDLTDWWNRSILKLD